MKTTNEYWTTQMSGHHLVCGKLVDFLTGKMLGDTHDERYRQKLARFLVNKKGYLKKEIIPRYRLLVTAGNKRAIITIDFIISLKNRVRMLVYYGPGSLVSRHRAALAAARLIAPYQIPLAVVTNGENAEVLNTSTGQVEGNGLKAIPSKSELIQRTENEVFDPISKSRTEMESRIIYAFEVDDSCPCDDTICRL